jgi:hypothetical protein
MASIFLFFYGWPGGRSPSMIARIPMDRTAQQA